MPAPQVSTRQRAVILVALDAACWIGAIVAATVLRYDLTLRGLDAQTALMGVSLTAAALFVLSGFAASLYSGRHRLGSYQELVALGVAVWPPALILFVWLAMATPRPIALSVPLIALPIALGAMLAARAVLRAYRDRRRPPDPDQAPALVFGAGDAAEQLVRSMNRSAGSRYRAVAILDDDPAKARRRIDGVPVVGTRKDLARAAQRHGADRLVIAVPSAGAGLVRDLEQLARAAGLNSYILPPVSDLIGGDATEGQLHEVTEEDILGRRPIETDLSAIGGVLGNKVVLVTGAGGSIGSELCRQITRFRPQRLVMLDRDESALHAVQLSITGRALLEGDDLALADIRDAERIRALFDEVRPDVVFHAAALKHLSLLEMNPEEAWKTNVVGTLNVLRAARASGVGTYINISTDKAANPTCVLGYSKRITERLTSAIGEESLGTYASVRFGNVLGSRGSMLGTFRAQVEAGGPVTVTHPDVTRFFMTIPEAVQLVLQSASIANDGEVLILDMGDEVRIDDVARRLIERSGKHVDIVYTGLRTGEKLREELLGEGEVDRRPNHPLITQAGVPALGIAELSPTDAGRSGGQMGALAWRGLVPSQSYADHE
jgi:FlaA1/EpsC-like NDP-sugar epimerase